MGHLMSWKNLRTYHLMITTKLRYIGILVLKHLKKKKYIYIWGTVCRQMSENIILGKKSTGCGPKKFYLLSWKKLRTSHLMITAKLRYIGIWVLKHLKKIIFIYIWGPGYRQNSVKLYNEISSDSHFFIYGPIFTNNSLKFLSWLDLKNYVYIYIYIQLGQGSFCQNR